MAGAEVADLFAGSVTILGATVPSYRLFVIVFGLGAAAVKGAAKDSVNGLVSFDSNGGNQRPGLVLVNGEFGERIARQASRAG